MLASAARFRVLAALTLLSPGSIGALAQDGGQSAETLFRVGVGNLRLEKYWEAELAFRKLMEIESERGRGILGLAEVYFAQKKPDEAVRLVEAETQKCAARVECTKALADTLLRAGQDDRAAVEYRRAIEQGGADSTQAGEIWLRLAELHRRRGQREEWGAALQKAAGKLKDNPVLLTSMGVFQDAGGQREEALNSYREAVRVNPNHGPALNNLAYLMIETGGDLDVALRHARKARQLLPDSPEVADTLGWIYVKKGWADVAILVLKEALTKDPASEGARKHMAAALELKTDPTPAITELKAALRQEPSPENQAKLLELLPRVAK